MARKTYKYDRSQLTLNATVSLTPAMRDALKELSVRCKDEKGRFMDRSQLLRALVAALVKLESQIDWREIKTEEDLIQRIYDGFKKM